MCNLNKEPKPVTSLVNKFFQSSETRIIRTLRATGRTNADVKVRIEMSKMHRQYIGKQERAIAIEQSAHCCTICGYHENVVGTLEYAHIIPKAEGGKLCSVMCPNCHVLFDTFRSSQDTVERLGLDYDKYHLSHKKRARVPNRVTTYDIPRICADLFVNIPDMF